MCEEAKTYDIISFYNGRTNVVLNHKVYTEEGDMWMYPDVISHTCHSPHHPPLRRPWGLNLEVDEGGEAHYVLQQHQGPLQGRVHVDLHVPLPQHTQAGLSDVVTVVDLQRAQLGAVLGHSPANASGKKGPVLKLCVMKGPLTDVWLPD